MSKTQKITRQAKKAESVWEQRQVAAAAAWYRLREAEDSVLEHRDELTEEQWLEVQQMLSERRGEVKEFLLKHRDLYVDRMNALGMIPTPMAGRSLEEELDWSQVTSG
jgi:acyl-CoA reductase-like NAD-dependent aldehyde dehydrogenase